MLRRRARNARRCRCVLSGKAPASQGPILTRLRSRNSPTIGVRYYWSRSVRRPMAPSKAVGSASRPAKAPVAQRQHPGHRAAPVSANSGGVGVPVWWCRCKSGEFGAFGVNQPRCVGDAHAGQSICALERVSASRAGGIRRYCANRNSQLGQYCAAATGKQDAVNVLLPPAIGRRRQLSRLPSRVC